VTNSTDKTDTIPALPAFPRTALTGSLGELAAVLSAGTEVSEEFVFAAALTVLGAYCSKTMRINVAFPSEPRLFTVLLGESYLARKSTALRQVISFFQSLDIVELFPTSIVYGVGSGEGLAKLVNESQVLLAYDELASFTGKASIDGASLLPLTASLFDSTNWDNTTKTRTTSIRDGHLALVGCCTTDTYASMWRREAISIGFTNRLFIVSAEGKPKVSWPQPRSDHDLAPVRKRLREQMSHLPHVFDMTPEAKKKWDGWYQGMPDSIHAKRLDTIGFRLMPLLALTNDEPAITLRVVEMVISILDYELQIRELTDPIDAEDRIARLEIKILRHLKGRMTARDLRRTTHADRDGLWAFDKAIENLRKAQEVKFDGYWYSAQEKKE
jgi:hypothetical protein